MSNSENYSDENRGSSSHHEAVSEEVKIYEKYMKEILSMLKIFNSYMYEPEMKIFSTIFSSELD